MNSPFMTPPSETASASGNPSEKLELPRLDVSTRTLSYLQEAARLSTFTEAADELGVSQPALSQSLAVLEKRLGLDLFEQDGRRRRLTEAGEMMSQFAAEVLGRTGELQARLDAYRTGSTGLLRIGLIDAAALYLLPEALAGFRNTRPDVRLRVVVEATDLLCDRLADFDLDLVFCVGHDRDGLTASPICQEALRVYARNPQEDPAEVDWALYPGGSRTRALIDKGLADAGIAPSVTMESRNPEVLRQLAEVGLTWTVLPERVGSRAGGLSDVFSEPAATRTLVLMRRSTAPSDPRAEALETLARKAVSVS